MPRTSVHRFQTVDCCSLTGNCRVYIKLITRLVASVFTPQKSNKETELISWWFVENFVSTT